MIPVRNNKKVPKPSRVTRSNSADLVVARTTLPSARGEFANTPTIKPEPITPKPRDTPRAGEIIRSAPGVQVTNEDAQRPRKLSKTRSIGANRGGQS
jgi:hypothetical protein